MGVGVITAVAQTQVLQRSLLDRWRDSHTAERDTELGENAAREAVRDGQQTDQYVAVVHRRASASSQPRMREPAWRAGRFSFTQSAELARASAECFLHPSANLVEVDTERCQRARIEPWLGGMEFGEQPITGLVRRDTQSPKGEVATPYGRSSSPSRMCSAPT